MTRAGEESDADHARLSVALKKRNAVHVAGAGSRAMVLVHGFGVDQHAWDRLIPYFESDYSLIRYDLTGLGESDVAAYDRERYATLRGHAQDLLEICEALRVRDAVVVGHSAGAMVAALAHLEDATRFAQLIMLSASARYIDEPGYRGGFSRNEVVQLIHAVSADYVAWCRSIVPFALGDLTEPALQERMLRSFISVDPAIALHLATTVFFADHRQDVARIELPTLIVQASNDPFVPRSAADYLAAHIPDSRLHLLKGQGGHFPHLGVPDTVAWAIRDFLHAQ